jgi:TIR domain/Pentapeptide repeats (8 copies)
VFAVADKEHVDRLRKGVGGWNEWRRDRKRYPDLRQAALFRADLIGADLNGADLRGADLRYANLTGANLSGANLSDATLGFANLSDADLSEANLSRAVLYGTVLANIDLSVATGLKTCRHFGPSAIDFRALKISRPLPLEFLRGVGLPNNVIDYLPSLLSQPIQYYSCFISYSSRDDDFAKRIHADLQSKGVRCWFAPHDLPIGGKILDEIDAAIRLRDKVLLILSEHSIGSNWVEDEVKTAYEEERRRGQTMPVPGPSRRCRPGDQGSMGGEAAGGSQHRRFSAVEEPR